MILYFFPFHSVVKNHKLSEIIDIKKTLRIVYVCPSEIIEFIRLFLFSYWFEIKCVHRKFRLYSVVYFCV